MSRPTHEQYLRDLFEQAALAGQCRCRVFHNHTIFPCATSIMLLKTGREVFARHLFVGGSATLHTMIWEDVEPNQIALTHLRSVEWEHVYHPNVHNRFAMIDLHTLDHYRTVAALSFQRMITGNKPVNFTSYYEEFQVLRTKAILKTL